VKRIVIGFFLAAMAVVLSAKPDIGGVQPAACMAIVWESTTWCTDIACVADTGCTLNPLEPNYQWWGTKHEHYRDWVCATDCAGTIYYYTCRLRSDYTTTRYAECGGCCNP